MKCSSIVKDYSLQACDALQFDRCVPAFWMNLCKRVSYVVKDDGDTGNRRQESKALSKPVRDDANTEKGGQ
jgi:hypothetical protein